MVLVADSATFQYRMERSVSNMNNQGDIKFLMFEVDSTAHFVTLTLMAPVCTVCQIRHALISFYGQYQRGLVHLPIGNVWSLCTALPLPHHQGPRHPYPSPLTPPFLSPPPNSPPPLPPALCPLPTQLK